MDTFFDPSSYQIANGKWVPSFIRIIQSGPHTNTQENSWDKQFDSQEKADKYIIGYCLQQGYIQVDKK